MIGSNRYATRTNLSMIVPWITRPYKRMRIARLHLALIVKLTWHETDAKSLHQGVKIQAVEHVNMLMIEVTPQGSWD
jgi:hypothetical protein